MGIVLHGHSPEKAAIRGVMKFYYEKHTAADRKRQPEFVKARSLAHFPAGTANNVKARPASM
jgi:hypothetical protein